MDNKYIINDSRILKILIKSTFCGYKKTDVINVLFKSIDSNKID